MAGGVGKRFWPKSRKLTPKQFLNIFGKKTMIQETVDRLDGFIQKDRIFIVTNKIQKALAEEQLDIPAENIIAEPVGRNTAPCIGLAAKLIRHHQPNAIMAVLPADHVIKDKNYFIQDLTTAFEFAEQSKSLVTFGIQPHRPEIGYGYIHFDDQEIGHKIYRAIEFVEKPNMEKAEYYYKSGRYLWNSGMFVWRIDVILEELKKYQPGLFSKLEQINRYRSVYELERVLTGIYPSFENISIDYAVMEKAKKVHVIKSDFGWSDVGHWEAVYEQSEKLGHNNVILGDVYLDQTQDSYIHSQDRFTAVIGAKNLIIVNTKDALLVCDRDMVQKVKDLVNYLENNNRKDLI